MSNYKCDRCWKKVDKIYSMPNMMIDGSKINICNDNNSNLCESCANIVISEYEILKKRKLKICPRGRKKPTYDIKTLDMIMGFGGWVCIVFKGKIDGYEDHYDPENYTTTFDSNDLLIDREKIFGLFKERDEAKGYYTYLSVMK